MEAYRRQENNAAKLGEEYKAVVELLQKTSVLPFLSKEIYDAVEEYMRIARRCLQEISGVLCGWYLLPGLDDEDGVQRLLAQAGKIRSVCATAVRESKETMWFHGYE